MSAADDSDEKLMLDVKHGRKEALEALLRRHATPLLTFLHRLVGNRSQAEELFQEVFLTVWARRSTYHPPKPFKPWLYAVAINKVREVLRRKRVNTVSLEHADLRRVGADSGKSPATAAMDGEDALMVAQAVARLPMQQRAVVVLRFWEDMPYAEIANLLGCEEATARSHMHHGLAAIRRMLPRA